MTTSPLTLATPERAAWFVEPARWADMDRWHRAVRDIRENAPVLRCELEGFDPFLVLTRHADVFEVSRNNDRWINTHNSVLGRIEDMAQMEAAGMIPASLVHLDGDEHRDHRKVTNDWFKPAVVGTRQPRIDELADEYVQKMRDAGGECDFADIAQRYTLRVSTVLTRLANQLDHLELAGEPSWSESGFVSGVKHLPIAYRFK